MIVAHEAGVANRITSVPAATNPAKPNAELARDNPVMKIPALITDDGMQLVESKFICEYLDAMGGGKLIPANGPARWKARRLEAIADGLADAAILVRYEIAMRPENLRWSEWISGQTTKVVNSLDLLESEASSLEGELTIGQVAVASALSWLEFRNIVPDARAKHPRLFAWLDRINTRPSFAATMPKAA
jgi:glutathione S-transferase